MEENFNIHLGKKLRMRRLSLGLTQTKVAQAINVTFQQIQKYEKGTNGVSSNRLMQLSQFLKVPIIYFFEDFKEFKDVSSNEENNDDLNYSFLSRTFSSLSKSQKDKILQIPKKLLIIFYLHLEFVYREKNVLRNASQERDCIFQWMKNFRIYLKPA